MFEHRSEPLLPRPLFVRRVAKAIGLAVLILILPLGLGMLGYHSFQRLTWDDSFVNAAMILSGMGPLSPPQTRTAKIFEGCYALFSGFVLLGLTGIVLAPFFHRVLHRFHLSRDESDRWSRISRRETASSAASSPARP